MPRPTFHAECNAIKAGLTFDLVQQRVSIHVLGAV